MNLRTPSFQAPQSHTHCSMIAAAFLDKCRTKVSEQLLVKACYDQTSATNTTAQAPLRSTLASTMTMEGSCTRTSWLITSPSYTSARRMLVQSFEGNPQARHATSAKPPHLLPGNEIPMKLLMTELASPTWIPASPKATLNASTQPPAQHKATSSYMLTLTVFWGGFGWYWCSWCWKAQRCASAIFGHELSWSQVSRIMQIHAGLHRSCADSFCNFNLAKK